MTVFNREELIVRITATAFLRSTAATIDHPVLIVVGAVLILYVRLGARLPGGAVAKASVAFGRNH